MGYIYVVYATVLYLNDWISNHQATPRLDGPCPHALQSNDLLNHVMGFRLNIISHRLGST